MLSVKTALQNYHVLSGLISQSLLKTKELALSLSMTVSFQNRSKGHPELLDEPALTLVLSPLVAHLLTATFAEIELFGAYR